MRIVYRQFSCNIIPYFCWNVPNLPPAAVVIGALRVKWVYIGFNSTKPIIAWLHVLNKQNTNVHGVNHNQVRYIFTTRELTGDIHVIRNSKCSQFSNKSYLTILVLLLGTLLHDIGVSIIGFIFFFNFM